MARWGLVRFGEVCYGLLRSEAWPGRVLSGGVMFGQVRYGSL